MARIRSFKAEIHTSEQVADCCIEAAYLFWGIWPFCDDAGRHPASARKMKGEVFPLRDYTTKQVEQWRDELVKVGLFDAYSVNGEDFIEVTGWTNHQKIDNPTYRYPDRNGVVPETPPYRRSKSSADSTPNSTPYLGRSEGREGSLGGKEADSPPAIGHILDEPRIDKDLYTLQLMQHKATPEEIAYAESELRRRKTAPRKWTAAYMWPIICDLRERQSEAPSPKAKEGLPPMDPDVERRMQEAGMIP